MGEKNEGALKRITIELENSVGRVIRTPRDFDFLRQRVFARTRNMISASTLKRLWNYMPQGNIRESSLSILSQFLGYKSWDAFLKGERAEGGSDFVLSSNIWSKELEPDARIELTWMPGRRCLIRHLGEERFVVMESENTRLKPKMTFRCSMFIEDEPLYINDLNIDGVNTVSYVCGKISGIHFEIMDND